MDCMELSLPHPFLSFHQFPVPFLHFDLLTQVTVLFHSLVVAQTRNENRWVHDAENGAGGSHLSHVIETRAMKSTSVVDVLGVCSRPSLVVI